MAEKDVQKYIHKYEPFIAGFLYVKFSFSEKATKICVIILMVFTFTSKCQNHKEDGTDFCGLLRKAEL